MKLIFAILRNPLASTGNLLFAVILIHFASGYGTKWSCGRYCMPRSIISRDGKHYGNGDVIDPFTRALIANDREEETIGALLLICLGLAMAIGIDMAIFAWRHKRRAKRFREGLAKDLGQGCRCGKCLRQRGRANTQS